MVYLENQAPLEVWEFPLAFLAAVIPAALINDLLVTVWLWACLHSTKIMLDIYYY